MARGRPVVVSQAALILAYSVAGSHAALGQTRSKSLGIQLDLPSISIPGVITTTPVAVGITSSGVNATLPTLNAAGIVTTSPASLQLGAGGLDAKLPGANVAGLITATQSSARIDNHGASVSLPGANVAGVVTTSSTSVSLSGKGAEVILPGINVANLASVSSASVSLDRKGASVILPGVSVANAVSVSPTSVGLGSNGLNVTLPAAEVAGLVSVPSSSITLNDKGVTVALPPVEIANIKMPSVNINVGGQSLWSLSDRNVINLTSPITQLFAGMGSAEAFAPVEQLLGSLAFGGDAPSSCASLNSATLAPAPTADIWSWNSVTVGRTEHDGYRVNADGASCGSTLPFQTSERAQLPGVLWDASAAFGLKKGTLHLGFSSGASDSDTQIKASAALRDAGIAQAGSNRMRSWSVGGFSLLTTDNWYAGSAFGSAWGQTESQNFALGSSSDYDTSTFVAAGFLGTIVPLTDNVRFDLRGTLSYQRTVGDAHIDSLGLVYGDHVIEAADAMLSGRLFGVFTQDGVTIRPFIQAGITHHLRYSNQLEIDGIAYALQEDDTSLFAATGLDFEIDRTLQLSVGVRHDRSSDTESVTGRFGLTLRLN